MVTTPVAGFRGLGPPFTVANADGFVDAVSAVLDTVPPSSGPGVLTNDPPTWTSRAIDFLAVLDAASGSSG